MKEVILKTTSKELVKLILKRQGKYTVLLVNNQEYRSTDFFSSLLLFRKDLEKHNIKLLCNGSRYDVYPSRMTIQMSEGKLAYALTFGKQTSDNNIVNIFEPAMIDKIATINEQEDFYRNWIQSLRKL